MRVPLPTQLSIGLSYPQLDTGYFICDSGLFRSTDSSYTWEKLSPTPPTLDDFAFFNGSDGYAAGLSSYTAYHTSDAGRTWTSANDYSPEVLYIDPVTPDTCFLAGSSYVSRTTDAGKTWHAGEINCSINAISFHDTKHGIVVGLPEAGPPPHFDQTGGCFMTSDGGDTWTQKYTGAHAALVFGGVVYATLDTIVATGGNGYVTRSTNGGEKWDSVYLPGSVGPIGYKNGRILTVGRNGEIFTSTDAGYSWDQEQSGVSSILNQIVMLSDSVAFAAGGSVLLKTTNGGESWVQIMPPSVQNLQPQTFPEPTQGVVQFSYTLPQLQDVTITIYDMTGKVIASPLVKDLEQAGSHTLPFDGSQLPAGVYNYQIQTERYHASGKFTIVK